MKIPKRTYCDCATWQQIFSANNRYWQQLTSNLV